MDRWYEPPVSFDGLARTYRAAVHHSSPIAVKRNILTSTFIPHPQLSQQAFSRFVQDYLVFGNAYLEKRNNRLGGILSLEPSPAKYTRRGVDLDTYWFVQYGMATQPYEFTRGSIFHLMEPDLNQEFTACQNTCPPSPPPCWTSPPRFFVASITSMAAMQGSSCI